MCVYKGVDHLNKDPQKGLTESTAPMGAFMNLSTFETKNFKAMPTIKITLSDAKKLVENPETNKLLIQPQPSYPTLNDVDSEPIESTLTGNIFKTTTKKERIILQAETKEGVLLSVNSSMLDKVKANTKVKIAFERWNDGSYTDANGEEKTYHIPVYQTTFL